ncbi:hypothetical protein JAAARDRAFT_106478, partial [Jaapia argillacea MUCL 33604]
MNTINSSTGFTPFQLRMGRSPHIIPPLLTSEIATVTESTNEADAQHAADLIKHLEINVLQAQDNLLVAKVSQAAAANAHRGKEDVFVIGDLVMLSTLHCRRDYLQ